MSNNRVFKIANKVFEKYKKNGLKKSFNRFRLYVKTYGLLGALKYVKNSEEKTRIILNSKESSEFLWEKKQIKKTVNLKGRVDINSFNEEAVIHIHVFYLDIFQEMIERIKEVILCGIHLRITVISRDNILMVQNLLVENKIDNYSIKVVDNIGRDLAPLFNASRDLFLKYKYVCHLHTKKSTHIDFGEDWRRYLVDNLAGSKILVEKIIHLLSSDENNGVVYPINFSRLRRITKNDVNVDSVKNILGKLNPAWRYEFIDYPAGSMCWMRSEAYIDYLDNFPSDADYGEEIGKIDNTIAHAMERLISIVPHCQGYKVTTYWPSDFNRKITLSELNSKQISRWGRDSIGISRNEKNEKISFFQTYNDESLNIHWVIPDFVKGAGGHQTIFRIIKLIENMGHKQTVWIQNADVGRPIEERKEEILSWYADVKGLCVAYLPVDVEWLSGDVVIATDCWTAYPVAAMKYFKNKYYFIQDWESQFHPVGAKNLIIKNTYNFGFYGLTAGEWLRKKAEKVGMNVKSFDLCSDFEVYRRVYPERKFNSIKKIAFYARKSTDRRAVDLGLEALQELWERGLKFNVIVYGQNDDPTEGYSFDSKNLGVVSPERLNNLYNEVDIGMVFSATNYSLIPLEMMACGLPVVELNVESITTVFPEEVLCLVDPNPGAIADKLENLLNNEVELNRLSNVGFDYSKRFNWVSSAEKIIEGIKSGLCEAGYKPYNKNQILHDEVRDGSVTIIIPTYNPGKEIWKIFERINSQKYHSRFELLVVDSQSDNGFQNDLASFGVKYLSINKDDFQHGRTRRQALQQCTTQYAVFLTQDSMPANNNWLSCLIGGFSSDPSILGVFSRHVAYQEHDQYTRNEIDEHFRNVATFGKIRSWEMDDQISPTDKNGMMARMFYSDNSSAIKVNAGKYIQYPEIDWGEDQVWAWEVIKSGFKIAYAEDSVVVHSHELEKNAISAIQEERMYYNYFGLRLHESMEHSDLALSDIKNKINTLVMEKKIDKKSALLIEKFALAQMKSRCGRYYLY